MFAISIDLDWAPKEAIQLTFELLADYEVRSTVFCTHKINTGVHEPGLHPNFETNRSPQNVISDLKNLYPNAKGIRSHALQINSRLYLLYRQMGLAYSSSYYMFNQPIRGFRTVAGMIELPIFFEDDLYFGDHGNMDLRPQELEIKTPHLKIFNFHPIHIFMNTVSSDHYHQWKAYYQDAESLTPWMHKGRGTRDFFVELLEFVKHNNEVVKTLGEVVKQITVDGFEDAA